MNNKSKPKLLLLLENEDQYHLFKSESAKYAEYELLICCMSNYAIHFCELSNLPYIAIDESYSCFSEDEYDKATKESQSIIDDLVNSINNFSRDLSLKQIGFPMLLGSYYHLYLYLAIGPYHYKAFILHKLIEKNNPDLLVAFSTKSSVNQKEQSAKFRNDPAYGKYDVLLRNSKYSKICDFIEQDRILPISKTLSAFNRLKAVLASSEYLWELYYCYLRSIPYHFFKRIFRRYEKNALLISSVYNWVSLMKMDYEKTGILFSLVRTQLPKATVKENGNDYLSKIEYEKEFYGFDISAMANPKIISTLESFKEYVKRFPKISQKVKSADVLISSVWSSPLDSYYAHVAKESGVKVVLWEHGPQALWNSEYIVNLNELSFCDYYFSYGDAITAHYDDYLRNYSNPFIKALTVGSSLIQTNKPNSEIKLTNTSKTFTIIYATAKYLSNDVPFTVPGTHGADYRLFKAQTAILQFLENLKTEHPEYKIIWKLNNTPGYSEVLHNPSGIEMYSGTTNLYEILSEADFFIFDYFGSSVFEAAITDKPIFMLANRLEYLEGAIADIKKRCVVSRTEGGLVAKLDEYFKEGLYEADIQNKDALINYATGEEGKDPSETALTYLKRIMDGEDV